MSHHSFYDQEENVSNPIICDNLDYMVRYAAGKLAPLLGIETSRLVFPEIVLSKKSGITSDGKILQITPKYVIQENTSHIVDHEATHLAHLIVNQKVFEQHGEDYETTNLVELVASYGARILSSEKHPSIEEARRKIAEEFDSLDQLTKKLLEPERWSRKAYILAYETRMGADYASEFLFTRFGSKYFRDFALADVKKAKEILNGLGYKGPLHMSYKPVDEFKIIDKENGEEILQIIINELGEIDEFKIFDSVHAKEPTSLLMIINDIPEIPTKTIFQR